MPIDTKSRVIARFVPESLEDSEEFWEDTNSDLEGWETVETCKFCHQDQCSADEGCFYRSTWIDPKNCRFCRNEPEWHPYLTDLTEGFPEPRWKITSKHPRYDWEYLVMKIGNFLDIPIEENEDNIPF